ncbi:MAG TPA: TerB family tellurite resistance protein [Gemmatimonadaceae bacterium]|nr:TerB family tellurite resistance protein [Gemmatimonadaceae bacterium]
MLALLAAIENVVPPVPSDAAVALGAFLSHRGVTTPILVFVVTWTANMVGAALVYLGARRFGHRLFATRTGRRLLAPRSLAVIEREYLRFGVAGIFLSRFLPGIRAVVPPFAGLVRLGPVRTFVPMALASMIWYGGITLMGTVLGTQWQRILTILEDVNRTMGIIAAALIVVGVAWYLLARRRRGGERLWHATRDALDPAAPSFLRGTDIAEGSAREAAALLVLELAYADPVLTPADRDLVAGHLRDRWGLAAGRPLLEPPPEDERRTRFAAYADRLRQRFGRAQRLELVERMWSVAFGDGAIGAQEARVMTVAAELLGLTPAEVAEVRRRVRGTDPP